MKLLAYEVDGHDTYWEIYTPEMSYFATVETDDFGDFVTRMLDRGYEDILIYSQEAYQAMYAIHIELDKFFGQPGDYLDDCEVIHDPTQEYDYFCEGCKAFQSFAKGKTYGDYYNNPSLWAKRVSLV